MQKILYIFIVSISAWANFETTIYDTSISTASKIVIGKEAIKDSKAPNMAVLLATQANINITNSAFQPNSLFIRGGDAGQILIILDDVPVYDSSTIQRSFNLNSVNVSQVEKITVIKGSQSAWYGGQAQAAVIKIDTIPKEFKSKSGIEIIGGSSSYQNIEGFTQSQISDTQIALLRGHYETQSSTSPVLESDFKYKKRNNNIDAIYQYRDESNFTFKVSQFSDRNENPTGASRFDFKAADTKDFINTTDVQQINLSYRNYTIPFRPYLTLGKTLAHRIFNQDINEFATAAENQEYKSTLTPLRFEMRLWTEADFIWDFGLSFQKEEMLFEEFKIKEAEVFNEMIGVFTKTEWSLNENTRLTGGLRHDSDLLFDDVSTFQVGASYKTFKLEHSTGYRLPSLYQLYSNRGNSTLYAEFARTYTFEQEFQINEFVNGSYTIFEAHIENQIAARGNPSVYYNVGRTITKGLETGLAYNLDSEQKVFLNLGYQEPRDVNTGKWLAKRPLKSGSLAYSKRSGPESLGLELVARGERDDVKNSTQTVRLNGYSVLNVSYSRELKDTFSEDLENVSLFFRGQNLLNERYEETYGYRNPGLEFYLGLSAEI